MEWLGCLAGGFGLLVALKVVLGATVGIAAAVLWVWMIVDALLRDSRDYPSGRSEEKLVWILLMIFAHLSAVAYLVLVFRKPRGQGQTPATVA